MNEESKQKISQFVDGDLDQAEAISLLKEMYSSPELLEKYNRYQAIGHALKNDAFLVTSSDFSARVSQQIEAEPTIIAPQPKSNFFMLYQKPCALAASIAIVAVLVHWREPNTIATNPSALLSSPLALSAIGHQLPAAPVVSAPTDQQQPVTPRIHQYLQAHNSSIYSPDATELKRLNQVAYSNKKQP